MESFPCKCGECQLPYFDIDPVETAFRLPIDIVKVGVWINHRVESHNHTQMMGKVKYPVIIYFLQNIFAWICVGIQIYITYALIVTAKPIVN